MEFCSVVFREHWTFFPSSVTFDALYGSWATDSLRSNRVFWISFHLVQRKIRVYVRYSQYCFLTCLWSVFCKMPAVPSQGSCIRFPLIALPYGESIYNARRWRFQVFFGGGGSTLEWRKRIFSGILHPVLCRLEAFVEPSVYSRALSGCTGISLNVSLFSGT